ncbi:hypothetical protein JD844_009130 [Phrynosoma platyrhinos]|uniref:RBPJ-interacting and tubulin-associated protein 1 n=1 Tax=Phrynosoma platyrhinos TaxID=52577 RepID=A0ABQ7TEU0_PHRPL|nr:hypothetical protein JD844_009130 [Phrynosoma platyrhinos]
MASVAFSVATRESGEETSGPSAYAAEGDLSGIGSIAGEGRAVADWKLRVFPKLRAQQTSEPFTSGARDKSGDMSQPPRKLKLAQKIGCRLPSSNMACGYTIGRRGMGAAPSGRGPRDESVEGSHNPPKTTFAKKPKWPNFWVSGGPPIEPQKVAPPKKWHPQKSGTPKKWHPKNWHPKI